MILRVIIFHRQYVVCLSCGKSEICSILFKHKSSLCDDASLPSNIKALKQSRYQTYCSELEISWKLISYIYKNTTLHVLVIFGCFVIIKDILILGHFFVAAVHVHHRDIRLSVYFHLRKINTRKAITASFVGKMIFIHVKHTFCYKA